MYSVQYIKPSSLELHPIIKNINISAGKHCRGLDFRNATQKGHPDLTHKELELTGAVRVPYCPAMLSSCVWLVVEVFSCCGLYIMFSLHKSLRTCVQMPADSC